MDQLGHGIDDNGKMEQVKDASLAQLPEEMLKFVLQHAATATSETSARLGRLSLRGRSTINTPNYIAPTSRGVIPHLSHDNLQKHTKIPAVYVALEDCTLAHFFFSAKLDTDFFGGLTVGG